MNAIDERVKKIIADVLKIKPEEAVNQASFVDDLGADSLDTVEIVMGIEEEFDLDIPDEEAEQIKTIQQAVDYVTKRVDEKEQTA